MSDLKRVKLLPCPFCGTEANGSWSHDLYSVECATACCSQCDFSEEKAIELWNTRALTEREAALLGVIKAYTDTHAKKAEIILYMSGKLDESVTEIQCVCDQCEKARATLKSLGIEGEG